MKEEGESKKEATAVAIRDFSAASGTQTLVCVAQTGQALGHPPRLLSWRDAAPTREKEQPAEPVRVRRHFRKTQRVVKSGQGPGTGLVKQEAMETFSVVLVPWDMLVSPGKAGQLGTSIGQLQSGKPDPERLSE